MSAGCYEGAEIILGTHRACAMYASEESPFALKTAETINASLVIAVPANGCEPIWSNAEAIKGSIAVVEGGACPLVDKVTHAQAVGALAVVVVNESGAVFALPGNLTSISIHAMLIAQEDGSSLKDSAATGLIATLKIGMHRHAPPLPPPPSPSRPPAP